VKRCIRCGEVKDESEFALNRYGTKVYRRNVCRVCYHAARPNHEDDEKPEGLMCRRCGISKPPIAFPRQRQCLYGLDPVCKACKLERRRERKAMFPEREREIRLKMNYGLTAEQYAEMLRNQDGKCAICEKVETPLKVDHNHRTGTVRGLLCHLCNAMIGCAREEIAILAAAAAYLHAEAHPEAGAVEARITFHRVGVSAPSGAALR
jgi:hypothetical protein